MSRFAVRLGPRAVRDFGELGPQHEQRVRNALRKFAARAWLAHRALGQSDQLHNPHSVRRLPVRDGELFSVRAGVYFAVCELLADERLIAVSAIVHRRELERRLGVPAAWTWMPAVPMGRWGMSFAQREAARKREALRRAL
jgi:hypothetical protein